MTAFKPPTVEEFVRRGQAAQRAVDAATRTAQVMQLNDEIQDWVNAHASEVPADLEHLLALLDLALHGP